MMSEWEWHRRAAQSLAAHHNTRAFDHIEEARRRLQESWLQLALLRDHELTRDEKSATAYALVEEAVARRMDVFDPEPHLDPYAWHQATDLIHDDVPFAALIAAALVRADTTNAGLIRACWPTLSETAQARYDAPGGRLPEDRR